MNAQLHCEIILRPSFEVPGLKCPFFPPKKLPMESEVDSIQFHIQSRANPTHAKSKKDLLSGRKLPKEFQRVRVI